MKPKPQPSPPNSASKARKWQPKRSPTRSPPNSRAASHSRSTSMESVKSMSTAISMISAPNSPTNLVGSALKPQVLSAEPLTPAKPTPMKQWTPVRAIQHQTLAAPPQIPAKVEKEAKKPAFKPRRRNFLKGGSALKDRGFEVAWREDEHGLPYLHVLAGKDINPKDFTGGKHLDRIFGEIYLEHRLFLAGRTSGQTLIIRVKYRRYTEKALEEWAKDEGELTTLKAALTQCSHLLRARREVLKEQMEEKACISMSHSTPNNFNNLPLRRVGGKIKKISLTAFLESRATDVPLRAKNLEIHDKRSLKRVLRDLQEVRAASGVEWQRISDVLTFEDDPFHWHLNIHQRADLEKAAVLQAAVQAELHKQRALLPAKPKSEQPKEDTQAAAEPKAAALSNFETSHQHEQRKLEEVLRERHVHVRLKFPENYPMSGPTVEMLEMKANYAKTTLEPKWRNVCMTMVAPPATYGEQDWLFGNWSPTYTAAQVLINLQAMINDRSQHFSPTSYGDPPNAEGAKCDCGHAEEAFPEYRCHPCVAAPESDEEEVKQAPTEKGETAAGTAATLCAEARMLGGLAWRVILEMLDADSLLRTMLAFPKLDTVCHRSVSMRYSREDVCYITKETAWNATLGIGIGVKGMAGDFIREKYIDGHLLSHETWRCGTREGPQGKGYQNEGKYTHFLPMALTPKHFEDSKKARETAIKAILSATRLTPSLKLNFLCDLMLRCVLQLAKAAGGGINKTTMCERAVKDFCRIHHLALAMMDEDPKIKEVALARLTRSLITGATNKSVIPDCGVFKFYMALIGDAEFSQERVRDIYIQEGLDRGHKWIIQKDSRMAQEDLPAEQRIAMHFDLTTSGRRMGLFRRAVLDSICNYEGMTPAQLLEVYNKNYGRPPQAMMDNFFETVKRYMKISTWREMLRAKGVPEDALPKSPKDLADQLWQSYIRSEIRQYNDNGGGYQDKNTKISVEWPQALNVSGCVGRFHEQCNGQYRRCGEFGGAPVWEKDGGALKIFVFPNLREGQWFVSRQVSTQSTNQDFYRGGSGAKGFNKVLECVLNRDLSDFPKGAHERKIEVVERTSAF